MKQPPHQTYIRIPKPLHAALMKRAERAGVSLNSLLCMAAEAYLHGGTVQTPPAPARQPIRTPGPGRPPLAVESPYKRRKRLEAEAQASFAEFERTEAGHAP